AISHMSWISLPPTGPPSCAAPWNHTVQRSVMPLTRLQNTALCARGASTYCIGQRNSDCPWSWYLMHYPVQCIGIFWPQLVSVIIWPLSCTRMSWAFVNPIRPCLHKEQPPQGLRWATAGMWVTTEIETYCVVSARVLGSMCLWMTRPNPRVPLPYRSQKTGAFKSRLNSSASYNNTQTRLMPHRRPNMYSSARSAVAPVQTNTIAEIFPATHLRDIAAEAATCAGTYLASV